MVLGDQLTIKSKVLSDDNEDWIFIFLISTEDWILLILCSFDITIFSSLNWACIMQIVQSMTLR